MKIIHVVLLMIIGMLFAACQPTGIFSDSASVPVNETDGFTPIDVNVSMNDSVSMENATVSVENESMVQDEEEASLEPATPTSGSTFLEGELIRLNPNQAADPDNDNVVLSYSAPFNAQGEWQTEIGDAGVYEAEITATDGKLTTIRKVSFEVLAVNKKPVISNFDDVSIQEGATVSFKPVITDEDGDQVTVTYSGWMDQATYRTTYTDAGVHSVTITASDGVATTTKTATVTVANVNRRPIFEQLSNVTVKEGESVQIIPNAADPDGDVLVTTFSKPLSANGEWKTTVGDAGVYDVTVSVSDGNESVEQNIRVVVEALNKAPEIFMNDVFTFGEGQTVKLNPLVTDEDNDNVTVTFSGWMTSSTKETSYNDAGEYTVVVAATDGKSITTKEVTIIVNDQNRAPVFVDDAFA